MSDEPYIDAPDNPAPKRVLVDISVGHGTVQDWTGTETADGSLKEAVFNREKLRPALQSEFNGHRQFTIRWWDAAEHPEWRQYNKKANLLLLDRLVAMYASQPAVEIALALHCNASKNKNFGGFMAIYRQEERGDSEAARGTRCTQSALLAQLLCDELGDTLSMKNRGAKPDRGPWVNTNLAFTRWAKRRKAVGVLLELGFMTNLGDVALLKDPGTPTKVAKAIRYALESFIPLRRVP